MKKKNNNNDKQSYILTKETLGMTILLFCFVVTVTLLTNNLIFSSLGKAICTFMYGTFGYGAYLIVAAIAYLGFRLVFEKKIVVKPLSVAVVFATVFCVFLLFHSVSTRNYALDGYGAYLSSCYRNASAGYSGYTFGGVISGILVYPIAKGTTFIGAYVIFSILTVLFAYLAFLVIRNALLGKTVAKSAETAQKEETAESPSGEREQQVDNLYTVNENYEIVTNRRPASTQSAPPKTARATQEAQSSQGQSAPSPQSKEESRRILFEPGEFAAESYRRNLIYNESSYFNHPVRNEGDYLRSFSSGKPTEQEDRTPPADTTYTADYSSQVESERSDADTPSFVYGESPVQDLGQTVDSVDRGQSPQTYTVNGESRTEPTDDVSAAQENGQTSGGFNRAQDDLTHYTDGYHQAPTREQGGYNPIRGGAPSDYGTASSRSEFGFTPNPSDGDEDGPVYGDEPSVGRNGGVSSGSRADAIEGFPSRSHGENDRVGSRDLSPRDQEISEESQDPSAPSVGGDESRTIFNIFNSSNPRLQNERTVEPDSSVLGSSGRERNRENLFDDREGEEDDLFGDSTPLRDLHGGDESASIERNRLNERASDGSESQPVRGVGFTVNGGQGESRSDTPSVGGESEARRTSEKPQEPAPAPEKPKHVWKKYVRPTLDLLDDYPENNNVNTAEIEESKQIICETLANFRIASQIANVVVGPAITRYDVIIEDKTNIKNALKYKEAIAMALMKENVNAYLNYSKGAISIEVPNTSRSTVGLKTMLASSQFINSKPNTLTFALGKNVEGQVVCPDITKMPHLLVAGTTGSGKSICLSSLIVSLLYKYGPEELRFILVDPKQVEFISYDKLPHLMINEIIYDVDKAIKALNWAIKEMENRYALFKEMTEKGVATKNLNEYNAHLPEGEEKLPKIVIILDEFGDLMLQSKKEIESRIIRLVQKARACGIHLILATQRPSVDCITGLIKSNLPTRIGFKVNSFDDARCIFDIGGAEKLLGRGDMYFRSADSPELARIQGCFIDTHEVQKVTDFVKANNETFFDQTVSDFINTVEEPADNADEETSNNVETKIDDTFIKALKFCVTSNQASVSMIQRRFPIGYMKACKIIDWMENMNYITQSEGSKPRKVLLSREEFTRIFGDVDD